jgi:hypothetical protein
MPAGRAARHASSPRRALVGFAVLASVALLATACGGGGGDGDARVLEAGQVDIKLPAGYKVEGKKIIQPRDVSTAPPSTTQTLPGEGGATPTTAAGGVPIKKSGNPTQDLLKSFGKFRDCLNDLNVKFIGAPDPNNPQSPTNDPDYIESLSTCAARSNIVQALQAAQAEQDTLSPKEIKRRNESYLKWRDCMIDLGWNIPKPTPDEKGRLFAFGQNSGPQIEPPPGKDLFNSKDIEKCSTKAQRYYEKKYGTSPA